MTPKLNVQTVFLEVMFYLVLSGQVRGYLGKFGGNFGKTPWKSMHSFFCFFWDYFLWSIFRGSLEKFGQKSFALSGGSKGGGAGGPWPSQIFGWPPTWTPSFLL